MCLPCAVGMPSGGIGESTSGPASPEAADLHRPRRFVTAAGDMPSGGIGESRSVEARGEGQMGAFPRRRGQTLVWAVAEVREAELCGPEPLASVVPADGSVGSMFGVVTSFRAGWVRRRRVKLVVRMSRFVLPVLRGLAAVRGRRPDGSATNKGAGALRDGSACSARIACRGFVPIGRSDDVFGRPSGGRTGNT